MDELMQKRMDDLNKALAESLANHHMLLGRLEECKYMVNQADMQNMVDKGEPVLEGEVV